MQSPKKEKIKSKYYKKLDKPKTPYQRVLECENIDEKVKEKLRQEHKQLNPFELKRQIEKRLRKIFKYVIVVPNGKKRI